MRSLASFRAMTAARYPLLRQGNGWRAMRRITVRNPFDTGSVRKDAIYVFNPRTIKPLIAGGLLVVSGRKPFERLQLTPAGRIWRRAMPQMCIGCGCTETRACDGGCWWTTPEICSTCARGLA